MAPGSTMVSGFSLRSTSWRRGASTKTKSPVANRCSRLPKSASFRRFYKEKPNQTKPSQTKMQFERVVRDVGESLRINEALTGTLTRFKDLVEVNWPEFSQIECSLGR